jgi:hypothetical protein
LLIGLVAATETRDLFHGTRYKRRPFAKTGTLSLVFFLGVINNNLIVTYYAWQESTRANNSWHRDNKCVIGIITVLCCTILKRLNSTNISRTLLKA